MRAGGLPTDRACSLVVVGLNLLLLLDCGPLGILAIIRQPLHANDLLSVRSPTLEPKSLAVRPLLPFLLPNYPARDETRQHERLTASVVCGRKC